MAAMNVETERVIVEVRQRPALWDSANGLYKDRDARAQCWQEVFEALFPDYNDEDNETKKEIEKMVQQRWKTARDAYIRSKNLLKNTTTGSGDGRKKVYLYFDDMNFLDKNQLVHVDESAENSWNTSSRTNQNNIPNGCNQETPGATYQDLPKNPNLTPRQRRILTNSTFRNKRIGLLRRRMGQQRQRKGEDTEEIDKVAKLMFNDNTKLYKNDDLSFFMSLLPITEKFTLHQKLLFRSEILKKAMEIGEMHNPYEMLTARQDSPRSLHFSDAESISHTTISNDPIYVGVPHMSEDERLLEASLAFKSEP